MPDCLICKNKIEDFISFGKMPIANGFLEKKDFADEYFFELKVGACDQCGMVQLTELVDSEKLFHSNYAYFSSISVKMAEHFKKFADHIMDDFGLALRGKQKQGLVVELGSNDGIMLRNFAAAGVGHLGIEPSANVAAKARENGVNTICEFFGEAVAQKVLQQYGNADAILAANVMCHIPDLHSVFAGAKLLLKEQGVFSFEDPYLGDIIEKASFDQIYDEHVYYFSVHSVAYLAALHGLEVFDAEPQTTHGGSMRYLIGHKGARPVSKRVSEILEREKKLNIKDPATYQILRDRVFKIRSDFKELLIRLKQEGHRVAGYGATSKSTTVLNFCQIGPDLIEFISDTTPTKIGKFAPGSHIPVVPYQQFKETQPDYVVLFAWNHGEEIIQKEQAFLQGGKHFISYVPNVHVI